MSTLIVEESSIYNTDENFRKRFSSDAILIRQISTDKKGRWLVDIKSGLYFQ